MTSAATRPARTRAHRAPWRVVRAGHAFTAGYVIFLAAFGVVPVAYGIYFAFTNADNYFAGLSNFTATCVVQELYWMPQQLRDTPDGGFEGVLVVTLKSLVG